MTQIKQDKVKTLALCIAALSVAGHGNASTTTTKNINLEAWIGSTESEVTYTGDLGDVEAIITSDAGCDLDNYLVCADATSVELSGIFGKTTATDTATRLNQVGYYNLKAGSASAQTSLTPLANGPERNTIYGPTVFRNKLWLFGGSTPYSSTNLDYSNAIWSSVDGVTWKHEPSEMPFNRTWVETFTMTEFNDELWFYTHNRGSNCQSRIWKTPDGINWTEVEDDGVLDNCLSTGSFISFKGKLWAIGEFTNPYKLWSSDDGINWTVESNISEISSWHTARATTQDLDNDGVADRLWLGGAIKDEAGFVLAYTDDMVNWTTISAEESGIDSGQYITTHNNQLVVSSYSEEGITYHTSSDGYTWQVITPVPAVSARYNYDLISFKGQLFSIGGSDIQYNSPGENPGLKDDFILRTSDLASWENVYTESEVVPSGAGQAIIEQVATDKIYVIGGLDGAFEPSANIWSSSDRISWEKLPTNPDSELTPRAFAEIELLGTEYVMTGGFSLDSAAPVVLTATWGDETDWRAATDSNLILASFHQMNNIGGRLVIVGGELSLSDVPVTTGAIESSDGIFWQPLAANISFEGFEGHRVVQFNNKFWLLGGSRPDASTGIWSTVDGVTWTEEASESPFGPRLHFSIAELNGKLVLSGGVDTEYAEKSDVWVSADGINWVQSENNLPQNIAGHSAFEAGDYENSLVVIGGADFTNSSVFSGILSAEESESGNDLSEWRQYGKASAQLDVIIHTVTATDSDTGEVIRELEVYDTNSATLFLEGDTPIESVVSTCGGELNGTVYSINDIRNDCAVSVTYSPESYVVTAVAIGSGSITPETSSVAANEVLTLSVAPASWWYVVDTIDGCDGSLISNSSYETAPVYQDCTVTATFVPWWSRLFR